MAKSTKAKKKEEIVDDPAPVEILVDGSPEVVEAVVEAPPETGEIAVEAATEVVEMAVAPAPKVVDESNLSLRDKINKFLSSGSHSGGCVNISNFLKSLYPPKSYNTPPEWTNQGVSKLIRNTLTDMQGAGEITISNNNHIRLGTAYYPESATLKTQYYNVGSVVIEVLSTPKN